MLILTRRFRQSIVIDGRIKVTVVSITADRVELGIDAPPDVVVDREEVHRRKRRQLRAGGYPARRDAVFLADEGSA